MATEGGAGSLSAIALNARPRPTSYGYQATTQTLHKPPLFQLLLVQCVLSPFTSHYGCIRTVVRLPMTTMSVRNERLPLDYATAQHCKPIPSRPHYLSSHGPEAPIERPALVPKCLFSDFKCLS
ncbi:hypothetical protein V2G26_015242 [Clonostachys chloroleuca]